ncbi:MmgE/PrpD family protein [Paracoccus binzhouensis]|uniref:MmgE/PrpD family protein n=1 Tax=Paracoccus binzhouensis TaxID=2796149 RepID=UPI0018EF0A6B|nr:MmgE/PrpD family protein [Paracoccus binzhouensis]
MTFPPTAGEAPDETPDSAALLADWIAGLRLGAVPCEARQAAKDCLVDAVACMVGGVSAASSRLVLETFRAAGSGRQVSVPGSPERLGLLDAAWLGGHSANALDFDDCFRDGAPSHPGATVIPPVLALAEVRGASGADLLRAVIAGYEVSLRIGRALDASPARKAQVMGYGSWQSFGATAAGASLMGLDPRRIRSAFGITALLAPVPGVRKSVEGLRPYGWLKNAYGACAQAGLHGALLAERGFHGHQSVFDGPHGFWIMAGSDRHDPAGYRGLGEDWMVTRVEFKPYACCRWAHTMLEALASLRGGLDPEDVAQVEVHGFGEFCNALGGELPGTVVDAQFSARYLGALELLDRSSARGLFEADLAGPAAAEMAGRISLHHEPAYDAAHDRAMSTPVRVVLRTRHGETRETYIEEPPTSVLRGGFPRARLCEKFLAICEPVLGAARAEAALETLCNIETATAERLAALLVPPQRAG